MEGAIISEPPRHGKSWLSSLYYPAWFVLNNPDKSVILASAEAETAMRWGRKVRDVVFEYGPPIFGVNVRSDSKSAARWEIEGHEGGMFTAGMGGTIVGRGAHLLIVDDPIKNHEQALSQTFRDKCWEFYLSVAETRAEPGCGYLVVLTRWHQDDIAGRLIEEINAGTRPNWTVVSLPALAEEDDPLGREVGEALWPEKFTAEWFHKRKNRWDSDEARLGPYWWESLYQQHPVPREGGDFKRKWFRYYTERENDYEIEGIDGDKKSIPKNDCFTIFTVDLAVSMKESADFFALGIWKVTPDLELLLTSVVRDHIEAPDQATLIKRLNSEHMPSFVGVESVGYQLALVQDLLRRGVPAKEVRVDKDKRARAQLAATMFNAGRVHFRSGASWLSMLEDELLSFPSGRNDDMVDVVSMAAREVSEFVLPRVS